MSRALPGDPAEASRRRFGAFALLTYLLSWPLWIAVIAHAAPLTPYGSFAPSVAALLLTLFVSGRAGAAALLRRLGRWRAPVRAWGVALLAVPVAHAVAILASAGPAGFRASAPPLPGWVLALAPLEILVLGGPLGEELGWRGYALPRLLERSGPLAASFGVAAVWIAWHAPLFWIPASGQAQIPFAEFAATLLAYSLLMTWLWLRSNGSLLLAVLFHASANVSFWLASAFFGRAMAQPSYGPWFVGAMLAGAAAAALRLRARPFIST